MPFPGGYTGGSTGTDWMDPSYGGGGGYDAVHFEGTGDDLSKCGPGTKYSWVYVYFRAQLCAWSVTLPRPPSHTTTKQTHRGPARIRIRSVNYEAEAAVTHRSHAC